MARKQLGVAPAVINDAATKKYVDDQISSGTSGAVTLSGTQTISGEKTFTGQTVFGNLVTAQQVWATPSAVGGSALFALNNNNGQVWQHLNKNDGSYSLWDNTNSKGPILVQPNSPDQSFVISPTANIFNQLLNMNSHVISNVTNPTNPQDAATKNYVDGAISAIPPTAVTYNTIANLRAASTVTSGAYVSVRGYYSAGDGGGGIFRWDSTDTTSTDNGGTILVPTSGLSSSGRWKRVYEGECNARWFGVNPSQTDNTGALQAAVDWVSTDLTRNPAGGYASGTVFIPMGYYRFSFDQGTSGLSTISIATNYVTIRGEGWATILTVRNHAYPNQLNYFFTFDAGYKALGGGIKDLCINGNSMLKWGIYLNTWHGIEFENVYVTDAHAGILDAESTISPNCGESVYVRHCEYQCTSGTNSCFIQYGIRFRSSSGASWSDCWISDCNFIGIWDTGIVLDGVIRFKIANIGVSSNYATTNTIDGASHGGVKHTVLITTTVNGTWSGGNGQHVVDNLYHESHEGNEDVVNFSAVSIESPVGGGGYNRYNRISNVNTSWNSTVAPAIFRITNDSGVDNRVMDNTFIGNRRPITTEGQIYVGSVVRNTHLWLTPNLGGLSSVAILDLGLRTRVNGQAFLTYRNSAIWPDNKRGQAEFDVGEISRDALTGRVILMDKNNDPVLIGPRPGFDVVAPYGAQRIQAMPTPDAPTVTPLGTGSTTWTYYVVGIDKDGNKTVPSPAGSTTVGPASLTSSTYNAVQWFPIPGAVKYDLLRGSTTTSVATNLVVTHYNDPGTATSAYTPSGSNPAGNLTVDGKITAGNSVLVQTGSFSAYNTSDVVTNYERVRQYWTSNVFIIGSEQGGTGTARPIRLSGAGYLQVYAAAAGPAFGTIQVSLSSSTATATVLGVNGTLSSSSGLQYGAAIAPTYNQSSTAGYTALLVNPTETATGSGSKLLADFQVGGSSKLSLSNAGVAVFGGDTNLYRSAADTLKTDDTLIVGTPGTATGSVATIDGTQTLQNKTISGANNVLSNIAQSSVTNLTTDLANAKAYDISYPQTLGTRAVGYGQNTVGVQIQRAITITSITYRCGTADASGSSTFEVRKNGTTVSGTSTSVAAASQVTGSTITGSWAFAAGDILTVYTSAIGTTPGTGLVADMTGTT